MADREDQEDATYDTEVVRERLNDLLSAHYRPAKHAGLAHSMLSTQQLLDIIERRSPGAIPREAFHDAMKGLGYHEEQIEGNYYWLLAEA